MRMNLSTFLAAISLVGFVSIRGLAAEDSIKIGNDFAYSGGQSSYVPMVKAATNYFNFINETKGFSKKIEFISLDSESKPPKSLENAKKLVEKEKLGLIQTL